MIIDDAPSGASPAQVNKVANPARVVAVVVAIYLAFSILLPLPRFDFRHLPVVVIGLLVVVPTFAFMLLQLWLSLSIVRLNLKPARYSAVGIVTLVAWVLILFLFHPFRLAHAAYLPLAILTKSATLGILLTLSLTSFGCLVSLIVKDRNLLLPVALIAMPIDFLGAMTPQGFTHDVVKHAPNIVASVSVSVPKITAHGASIGPIAFIGPGDVLFMALFFAAVQRFKMAERATFWWMYALLSISMIAVINFNFPVGALVPMGLAVIIANFSYLKLKRSEVFAVAYAGALVLGLVCLFFWFSHRYLFHSH